MNKSESKYFNTALRMDEALLALLDEKDLEYYDDCMALFQRLKDGEVLSDGAAAEENSVVEEG